MSTLEIEARDQGSEEIELGGGAAVALLSLSNTARVEPSTAEGLENGVGSTVAMDDSDASGPPEVPDLSIPPGKKEKKRKRSSDTVDARQNGEERKEKKQREKQKSSSDAVDPEQNEEGNKEQLKSSSDSVDAGQYGEERKEKKQKKKRKCSSDAVDAGQNGEENTDQLKSSSDTVDAEQKAQGDKEQLKSSTDTVDAGKNGEECKEKEQKKNRKSSSDPVDAVDAEQNEEGNKEQLKSSSDSVNAGQNGEERKEKKQKKKGKSSSDTVDAEQNGEQNTEQLQSSSDTLDPEQNEEGNKEQLKSSSGSVNAGQNGEERKEKKQKKKRKSSSDTVDSEQNGEENTEQLQSSSDTLDAEQNEEGNKEQLKSSSDSVNAGQNGEERKEKKQKKKRKSSSDTVDAEQNGEENNEQLKSSSDTLDAEHNEEGNKEQLKSSSDSVNAGQNSEERKEKKRKKSRKTSSDDVDAGQNGEENKEQLKSSSDTVNAWLSDLEEKEKERKRKRNSYTIDAGLNSNEKEKKTKRKKGGSKDVGAKNNTVGGLNGGSEVNLDGLSVCPDSVRKKRRKTASVSEYAGGDPVEHRNPAGGPDSDEGIGEGDCAVRESQRKRAVRSQEPANDAPCEDVSYVIHEKDVEEDIEYSSEQRNWKKDLARPDLFYGKFKEEEDEKLKTSVLDYIKLGFPLSTPSGGRTMREWDVDEGLRIVLHPAQHKTIARGCWLEIAKSLPNRPVKQIHSRAIRLLRGDKRGKWSAEEIELLKNLHQIHGNNWTKIASHMERSADLCKDRWRHLKLIPTRKAGSWQQDELDKLCKLVRRSLKVKASIPSRNRDRRKIRDDINWEWIAEEMQRDSSKCALVWYHKLASPMIYAKRWATGDDRLMLQRLIEIGATSEEALDWENILDHRVGGLCMERWQEMTKLLGKSDHVSFEDRLYILAKRYVPDLVGIEEEI